MFPSTEGLHRPTAGRFLHSMHQSQGVLSLLAGPPSARCSADTPSCSQVVIGIVSWTAPGRILITTACKSLGQGRSAIQVILCRCASPEGQVRKHITLSTGAMADPIPGRGLGVEGQGTQQIYHSRVSSVRHLLPGPSFFGLKNIHTREY